jgi:hypothetical protein
MFASETKITEFPIDNKYWRIDGFGALTYPIGKVSEPLIAIHLTELFSTFDDPLSNRFVIRGKHKVLHLKIGQMAIVHMGDVWHNQERCPSRRAPRKQLFTLSGDLCKLQQLGNKIFTNHEDVRLFYNKFSMSNRSAFALEASWAIVSKNPTSNIEIVVIPSPVLYQACVATSPAAIRRISWGLIDKVVSNHRYVHTSAGRKTLYVEVDKNIRTDEAFPHASLLVDPCGKREYLRFRNNLKADGANSAALVDTGRFHHIKFGFPFVNSTDLETHGKFFPLDSNDAKQKRWGFLVTKISKMKLNLIFDQLIVHRKNSGEKGANSQDPDLEENAWPVPPPSSVQYQDDLLMHSLEDPTSSFDSIPIAATGCLTAPGLQVLDDPKITQKFRRKVAHENNGTHDGTITTGESKNSRNGSLSADIQSQDTPPPPVTLNHFFETLELLRTKGYQFKTLATNNFVRFIDSGDAINFLPYQIPPLRSWHRMSESYNVPPRGYAVAAIQHKEIFHYFIELERKNTEAHSLAHISAISGAEIDARNFHFFMIEVARANGWNASSNRPNWRFERVRHSPTRGIQPFAAAICSALEQ